MGKPSREEINAMRLKAFASNDHNDRMAYYKACSGWFQDEDFRELDRAAEIARLTAALAEAVRAKECFQRMTRAHWEALCAMRNSINEYVPMPNTDSGPLFSPENGPIYADISERVIAALADAEARGYARGLEDANTPEHKLAEKILAELVRARTKFPGKNVTFAALVEEVGELATATFEESAERVEKEAVQVAVMAMRMVLDGDHCFDGWRADKGLDPLDPTIRALANKETGAVFPPPHCTAWEDCNHDGICHDPQWCSAIGPNHRGSHD